jgi:hypothetical protein
MSFPLYRVKDLVEKPWPEKASSTLAALKRYIIVFGPQLAGRTLLKMNARRISWQDCLEIEPGRVKFK